MDKYRKIMAPVLQRTSKTVYQYVCVHCGTSYNTPEQAIECFDGDIEMIRLENDRYVEQIATIGTFDEDYW